MMSWIDHFDVADRLFYSEKEEVREEEITEKWFWGDLWEGNINCFQV